MRFKHYCLVAHLGEFVCVRACVYGVYVHVEHTCWDGTQNLMYGRQEYYQLATSLAPGLHAHKYTGNII